MNRSKYTLAAAGLVAALATGAFALTSLSATTPSASAAAAEMKMPTTPAEHLAEASKYDKEATALETKADLHAKMAANYRGLISGGSKQETTYRSLASHCQRLADSYRSAALEAREMAKSHREMAQSM